MLKKVAKLFFPPQTKRGRAIQRAAASIKLAPPINYHFEYQRWIRHIEPEMFLPVVPATREAAPLFSIVIPFFNTPDKYLQPLLDSITGQAFEDWELIVADASTDERRSEAIKRATSFDDRCRYYRIRKNAGISGNTNEALKHVAGKYIVFCDHDDTLSPYALNEMAARIVANPSIDILYSDEDKLSDDGKLRHSPFFKPDWSPHLFLNTNYTNHLSVIRGELVKAVGGLRSEFDGAQDYDLLLRIHRQSSEPLVVEHIAKVLYHWREAKGSTAINHRSKAYAFEAGRQALQQYIDDGPVAGKVENIRNRPGYYRHLLMPNTIDGALIYIGVSDDAAINGIVANRLQSLTKTDLRVQYKVVSQTELEAAPLAKQSDTATFKIGVIAYPREADWLDRLSGVLELPDVAVVAPRILSADSGVIVDVGQMKSADGRLIEPFNGLASDDLTLAGHTEWVRDVDELKDGVVGYAPNKKNDSNLFRVVWAFVEFNHYKILGQSRFFNPNLQLARDEDGRIRPHVNH
jgi:glycosyltransferase involved in cell wall biosynthesis